MSQARAIQIVNAQGYGGFNTDQKKTLRNLVDEFYADLSAAVAAGTDPETLAAALISADANNAIVAGSDDLLFVDGGV